MEENRNRRLWFDTALDTDSTAHKYLVRKTAKGKDLLPIRVLCPDILARLQPGDEMYGQVVAYVKEGTIHKAGHEESAAVCAVDGDAVSVSGKICDIKSRSFSFENYECDFLELDVDTEMGLITVLTKADSLNAEPEIDDCLSAITYVSMDVAVPSERSIKMGSAFYEEKEYPNLPGDTEEICYKNGFEPNGTNAAKVLLAGIEKKDLFRFGRCCADYVQLRGGEDNKLYDRWDLVDTLADLLEDSVNAEEILNIVDSDGTLYPASGVRSPRKRASCSIHRNANPSSSCATSRLSRRMMLSSTSSRERRFMLPYQTICSSITAKCWQLSRTRRISHPAVRRHSSKPKRCSSLP